MNNKISFVAGSLSSAITIGLVGGLFANPALALFGLLALNGGVLAFGKESEEPKLKREIEELKIKLIRAEDKTNRLDQTLADSFKMMEQAKVALSQFSTDNKDLVDQINLANNKAKVLHQQLTESKEQLLIANDRINELELDVSDLTDDWQIRLGNEAENLYQQRAERLKEDNWNEHNRTTYEAIQLMIDYQNIAAITRNRFDEKQAEASDLKEYYSNLNNDFYKGWAAERDEYEKLNSMLESNIKSLQQELIAERNGDLLQFVPQKALYDWNIHIANDIGKLIFEKTGLPLALQAGWTVTDGQTTVAYAYSRSQDHTTLIENIKRVADDIAKELKIYSVVNPRKYELSDLVLLSFRREAPKPESNEEMYKVLVPHTRFHETILGFHDHRRKGKPTLRVMGASGDGKSLLVKHILWAYTQSEPDWDIWVSDPMDGSEEDFWLCEKVAKDPEEASEVFRVFAEAHMDRTNNKTKNPQKILAVFDEFDKKHPKEDKMGAAEIWTAIRHTNQRMILMGQSSEVSRNGWTWDEMKNCALVFVNSAIETALKHNSDIGWSTKEKNAHTATYRKIQEFLERTNADLERHQQTGVALVVIGTKVTWLEIPPALIGAMYSKSIKSSVYSAKREPQLDEPVLVDSSPFGEEVSKLTHCPTCGFKLRSKMGKMRCENKEHTKEMGTKSF
jgi:hypothetical protein